MRKCWPPRSSSTPRPRRSRPWTKATRRKPRRGIEALQRTRIAGAFGAEGTSALNASALNASALNASALNASALNASALNASALHASALHASALHASALHARALNPSALRRRHFDDGVEQVQLPRQILGHVGTLEKQDGEANVRSAVSSAPAAALVELIQELVRSP